MLAIAPPEVSGADDRLASIALLAPVDRAPVERLSVLTYNVHGLPTLLRKGEVAPLNAISDRLVELRRNGRQPGVVLLQEAFSQDAKRIGADAGYRHVVSGPATEERFRSARAPGTTDLDRSTYWWAGEGLGKYADSGLMILSDYPVVEVRRLAFPEGACAGFDCLSNKGLLLVSVELPGQPVPVDIVTTHLNSRGSAGVPSPRSLIAFRRQVSALLGWLEARRQSDRPLVLAGDFNIGSSQERRTAFFDRLAAGGDRLRLHDAVARYADASADAMPSCAREARERGKDWQFWKDGSALKLEPIGIEVPFGHEPDGTMLSDHIGFAVQYRLLPGAKRFGR